MRRIGLAVVLALSLALAPLAAETQQARSTPRIARVFANTPEAEITGPNPTSPYIRAFLQAMRELGWTDGQNIAIERRSAEGRSDRWHALVQDLIKSKVDLIVITAPMSVIQQVMQAGNGLPIVLVGGNPETLIQFGVVKSIARPGKNVARTADDLAAAIHGQSEAALARRPDAKNWSAKEIICHLRDRASTCS